jgi:hypothetical protein
LIGSGASIIAASSLGSHPACILERLPEALARFVLLLCFSSILPPSTSCRARPDAASGHPFFSYSKSLYQVWKDGSHPLGASIFSPHANRFDLLTARQPTATLRRARRPWPPSRKADGESRNKHSGEAFPNRSPQTFAFHGARRGPPGNPPPTPGGILVRGNERLSALSLFIFRRCLLAATTFALATGCSPHRAARA